MTESQIRTLFKQIADGEPGPPRVDTQLAHRRGRARLRWRRVVLAGTPVLAAGVAVALAAVAAPGWPGPGPAARPAAPQRFDPLVPYASFGWLPPGESLVSGSTGAARMDLAAASKLDSTAPTWNLAVYAAGQCDHTARQLTCSAVAGQRPGPASESMNITGSVPTVNGHRTLWSRTVGLAWQYARGGWAMLTPYPQFRPGSIPATVNRDAVTIAEHVAFGAAAPPLLFPAQLTGLPRHWQVSGATYVPDGSALRVRTYALNAEPAVGARDFDGGLTYQDNLPSFGIDPVTASHNPCSFSPGGSSGKSVREIINGYHVIVTNVPRQRTFVGTFVSHAALSYQDLCAGNADGLAVYISEYSAHPVLGLASLFGDHLRLLGTDPASWTTKPVR
jgi:hypothetical protein